MGLLIQETWINKTRGHMVDKSPVYESRHEKLGDLYRALLKEYGRCVSKVCIDTADNSAKQIGWCFEQKMKYEDCQEFYIRETWVTVHEKMPETKTTVYYKDVA